MKLTDKQSADVINKLREVFEYVQDKHIKLNQRISNSDLANELRSDFYLTTNVNDKTVNKTVDKQNAYFTYVEEIGWKENETTSVYSLNSVVTFGKSYDLIIKDILDAKDFFDKFFKNLDEFSIKEINKYIKEEPHILFGKEEKDFKENLVMEDN